MGRKKRVDSKLKTRSSAKLMGEIRDILNQDIPDPSGGIASILPSQPHTILGRPRENPISPK